MNEIDLEIDEMDLIRSQKENRKYTGEQYMLHSIEVKSNEEDGEDGECKEEVMDNFLQNYSLTAEYANRLKDKFCRQILNKSLIGHYSCFQKNVEFK